METCCNYFPVTLSKEVDLDPNGKYLFAYHPHGIISNGVSGALMTNALGFSNMFPGVHLHPLTLSINFCWPLYRELAYALGFCTVSKKSIDYLFGIGHSCLIVVGGAEESLMARPNTADLFLTNRKGFVAVAIKNGASLVPVYGFGENEGFDLVIPEPDSLVIKAQKFLKSLVGFTLPLYHGRTVFTYNYGFLPKRSPINVVVGPPIHTKYDPNPSKELVELVHKEYMDALHDLYERNKEKYTPGDVIPELKFV
ncbi:diacylglycerol O-acyltransferase 1 [Entomophthora muscae]|uniref:Diacylglycerol O-acyltransferase 1 n=1 Tax=Entomophthora muscae TaxID=34485 RepID=A0ACC2RVQ9_9FUNG|nr:diacylglycerol O-acyltransferase 1 [Entomophthora muscae]